MCTAATYLTDHFFFGRNLDYERGFGERVTVTPRSFPLPMRHLNEVTQHYAMIGMASVQAGYPLYYDAVNEKGLCIAGLNFVSSAVYRPCPAEGRGVAQFELIPWLLGSCAGVDEACRQNGQAYRMGGDEFAVLYSGGQAEKIEALRECCLQSFRDEEKPEFLGVSIGYEQVQDFESLAEVMKRADEMMYVVCFYCEFSWDTQQRIQKKFLRNKHNGR